MVSPDEVEKTYGEPSPWLNTLPDGPVSVWNTYSRGVFHLESALWKRVARTDLFTPSPLRSLQ
jgi:hypothetical protein